VPTPAAAPAETERIAALERALASLRQPQAGLSILELMPEETVVRGAAPARPVIAGDRPATLLLVAEPIAAGGRYRIRVGTVSPTWEGTVRADTQGQLALYLPAGSLPRGEQLLRVVSLDGGTVATYRVVVR